MSISDLFKKSDIEERPEWYVNVLKGIESMEHPKSEGTGISYSMRLIPPDDIDNWLATHLQSTFQEALLELIKERGIANTDFYKAAWMDRKLFSSIKNNPMYQPKKDTAIACCLALRLKEVQAEKLLRKAGYVLTQSNRRDLVIIYCLRHQIWDLETVNNILSLKEEKPLMV